MPKVVKSYRDFSAGLQTVRDVRDLKDGELANAVNVMLDKRGAIRTMGGLAAQGTINDATAGQVGGYGLAILESDYETEATTYTADSSFVFEDLGYFSVQLDIVSITVIGGGTSRIVTTQEHGLSAGDHIEIISAGDHIEINGTSENDVSDTAVEAIINATTFDFPSVGGNEGAVGTVFLLMSYLINPGQQFLISDSDINDGLYVAKRITTNNRFIYVDTDFSSDASSSGEFKTIPQNEILILLSDATNGALDTYSKNQNKWTPNQASVDTTSGNLANDVKLQHFAIDGALRICDAEFGNASKIQWFGLIKNTHFPGCTAEDIYFDWYAKDNDLAAPTNSDINETDNGDGAGYPTANDGFDIDITTPADSNSIWDAATYECAISFIYDGNQESLLFSSTGNFTVADGDSVSMTVKAKTDTTGYNPRITGGRLYCRIEGSDDPWILLCDIDMRLGARATLDGTYKSWTDGTTPATDIDTGTVTSLEMNIDTYETINGYSHEEASNSIGQDGEGWKTAVVANRRVFVANVRRYYQQTDDNKSFPDRICYSEINKFDTFPTSNQLDVVKGDAESYVCLKSYADRLLAFKQNSVQIINIAAPSDTSWYLEDNKKYMGIYHPAAACDTDFGIAWINKSGCFLYDGQHITNLIWDKIDATEWSSFVGTAANDVSIIGYERHKKQLVVLRDCTGNQADGGDIYLYDFYTKSWTKGTDIFTDTYVYTNFIHDWNGDLIIGEEDSGTTTFKKWSDTSQSHSCTIELKDDDFGNLIRIKKIYNVYVSVKEQGGAEEKITVKYRYDGNNGTWLITDFSSEQTIAANDEGVLVYPFSTPASVQSLQLQITYNGIVLVNDVSVENRIINKRVS